MEIEESLLCNNCGGIFPPDELLKKEVHGCYESDYGVYDQFSSHTYYSGYVEYCPHCGDDERGFEEGYLCNECGEFTKWLEDDKYGLCYDCVNKYTDEEYNEKYPS